MDVHHETLIINNDYEVHDFTEDPNFDQFINLIRGENNNEDDAMFLKYGSDIIINDCLLDDSQNHQLLLPCPTTANNQFDEIHQINNNEVMMNNVYGDDPNNPATLISSFSCFDEGVVNNRENEEGEYSSATTTATDEATLLSATPRLKTDRSKTLISERRRRSRMKEKLYALRALVPNITKMDKASIIGDAVSYVHDLQAQAKKLKAEVAGLEASIFVSENYKASFDDNPIKTVQVTPNSHPINKKIVQIEMVQVEERGYYVKIVCIKGGGGGGVAASLYRALESLVGFSVRNSNLETVCDTILLTFTLNVKAFEPEVNLPNLKLWVTGALLNQGFEFMPNFHS
ncbi:hypothetical protein PIB30_055193 [Stylosanthes scabra]|uniref:BHLH domain-containing protein n=1 Tax=Stylosanthes scabra TaxID=79078 RepID=A0ABU6ZHP7_9FABA|nr:hypothetical protein [Stylosanthes scabra]